MNNIYDSTKLLLSFLSIKQYQKIYNLCIIIPNDIIYLIFKIYLKINIHKSNICPCNLDKCKELWNKTIDPSIIYINQNIIHCNHESKLNKIICHQIYIDKSLFLRKCPRCYHVNRTDLIFNDINIKKKLLF